MDKQIKVWMDVVEMSIENILGTLRYNGLILDDLEDLMKDMERARKEAEAKIHICDICTKNKFVQDNICKQCWKRLHPDQEV